MVDINLQELFASGAHLGHRKRFWNPKMAPYIYGVRSDLHIIDLRHTVQLLEKALQFVEQLASSRGRLLFVGTKRSAQAVIAEQAQRCHMPYVDQRWCGGTLTNFKTIKRSVNRMVKLEQSMLSESFKKLTKKERLNVSRDIEKLNGYLGGIRDMHSLPDALFVVDVNQERIAIQEAARLSIPVIGVVDTNASPENITYPIPANDDAMQAIRVITQLFAQQMVEVQERLGFDQPKQKKSEPVVRTVSSAAESEAKPEPKAQSEEAKRSAKKVVKRVAKSASSEKEAADAAESTPNQAAVKKVVTKKTAASESDATETKPKTVAKKKEAKASKDEASQQTDTSQDVKKPAAKKPAASSKTQKTDAPKVVKKTATKKAASDAEKEVSE